MKKTSFRLKNIAAILYLADDQQELEAILQDLLTPAELKDLDERIAIIKHLLDGETQREIAKKLKVSISKVSRGSLLLHTGKGALAATLE
ncbi:helix-turn-helix domain-containing protein [Candidatus Peregrinibacteria bacterium]|nr:MAG: helix-turn-helix domain-containing protein [Candidatus Peregrinibacteria bacterium]